MYSDTSLQFLLGVVLKRLRSGVPRGLMTVREMRDGSVQSL